MDNDRIDHVVMEYFREDGSLERKMTQDYDENGVVISKGERGCIVRLGYLRASG